MKVDHSAVADIIPVDIPVNAMIAVAWYTAVAKPRNVLIYHSTTGNVNPFTWGEMGNYMYFRLTIWVYVLITWQVYIQLMFSCISGTSTHHPLKDMIDYRKGI